MRLYRVQVEVIVEAENEYDAETVASLMVDHACNPGGRVLTWDEPIIYGPVSKRAVLAGHDDEEGTVQVLADYDDEGVKR